MKIKKSNAFGVAVITAIIVIVVCTVLLILHNQFGFFTDEKASVGEYSIEFVVEHDGYIGFKENEDLYLTGSREKFGVIDTIAYTENGKMIVKASVNGMYNKDGAFLLNGQTFIAKNSVLQLKNDSINIRILNIA